MTAMTPEQAAYEAAPLGWIGKGVWPPAPYSRLDPEDHKFWVLVASAAVNAAQPALAAERERADKAEVRAAENAITWETSCLSCSAVLDSCLAETNRREGAEEKLAQAVLLLGEIREYAQTWMAVAMRLSTPQTRAEADCGRKILDLIDADAPTDNDEKGGERS